MNFPSTIIEDLKALPHFDMDKFLQAQLLDAPVSLRANPLKGNYQPVNATTVPWCPQGFYLAQRPNFTYDPLFHAGAYYVQEASSMFLHQVLLQKVNFNNALKILDTCAAPGGKSTLIASLINKESLLVCNEIVPIRAAILEQNIAKWGITNCIVTRNEPAQFKALPHFFDVILVDAPCSGSGLFRKEPAALKQFNVNHIAQCNSRQQHILTDILPSLKPGGLIIYATCSFSTEENEAMIDYLLENGSLKNEVINLNQEWNIMASQSNIHKGIGYRLMPHLVQGEGFFIAAFTKQNIEAPILEQNSNFKNINPIIPNTCIQPFFEKIDQYTFYQKADVIMALPTIHWQNFCFLFANLYILRAGFCVGKVINNQLIPHHELALSTAINPSLLRVPLTLQQAISYLKCETPILENDKIGWFLVTYQNWILGWIKIIPGRINNYLPKNWRILK
jgi:16S rRNA C967 or C1407 C5-methylase (RsmB/RsmF family)/NOL1/NOP2/fmu family ribosome biogenesis protein